MGNEWDIPELDPVWACRAWPERGSWVAWGEMRQAAGAYAGRAVHFYVDDHKISRLGREPGRLVACRPMVAVEPNFSAWAGQPRAEALWAIYRKRAAAAWWGGCGIPLVADISVDHALRPLMMLGIPRGWPSYAVRVHRDSGPGWAAESFALAREWSGLDRPLLAVFGGGRVAEAECGRLGLHHVPERMRRFDRREKWRIGGHDNGDVAGRADADDPVRSHPGPDL